MPLAKPQNSHPYRWGLLLAWVFTGLDAAFLAALWLVGGSYIPIGAIDRLPVLEQVQARGAIARVWAMLHAPVDTIFGPYLFVHFRAHDGNFQTILSEMSYFLLCFAQMFLIGFLLGILLGKLNSRFRKQY
jgi:hypothetical protein